MSNNDLMDTLVAMLHGVTRYCSIILKPFDTLSLSNTKASKPRFIAFDPSTTMIVLATGLERANDRKNMCERIRIQERNSTRF